MNIGRFLSSDCKTQKIISHVKEKIPRAKKLFSLLASSYLNIAKVKMNRKSSMIKKKAPMFDTVMPFYVFLMKKTGRHDSDFG